MITSLRGTLAAKSPTEVVIDISGVGFSVTIPLSTFETLPDVNGGVSLLTHLIVREDLLQLYGFATAEERDVFRVLISVTGIGPKMAIGILSGIPVDELRPAIARGDTGALTAIPGVGRKLADRLIVELRDTMGKLETAEPVSTTSASGGGSQVRSEAALALISLGYNRVNAERAIRTALQNDPSLTSSLEALIKAAIRHAQR